MDGAHERGSGRPTQRDASKLQCCRSERHRQKKTFRLRKRETNSARPTLAQVVQNGGVSTSGWEWEPALPTDIGSNKDVAMIYVNGLATKVLQENGVATPRSSEAMVEIRLSATEGPWPYLERTHCACVSQGPKDQKDRNVAYFMFDTPPGNSR
jgi:hypothetical protein